MMKKGDVCYVPAVSMPMFVDDNSTRYLRARVEEVYPNHIVCCVYSGGQALYRQSCYADEVLLTRPEPRQHRQRRGQT